MDMYKRDVYDKETHQGPIS